MSSTEKAICSGFVQLILDEWFKKFLPGDFVLRDKRNPRQYVRTRVRMYDANTHEVLAENGGRFSLFRWYIVPAAAWDVRREIYRLQRKIAALQAQLEAAQKKLLGVPMPPFPKREPAVKAVPQA
jgi:hypothetical protein